MKQRVQTALLCLLVVACLLPTAVWAQNEEEPPAGAADGIPQIHVVEEGENLTYIAGLYGVTVEALMLINNLTDSSILSVGQSLNIPGGQGEAVATLYTIRPGDSVAEVASLFHTTADAVAQANRLIDSRHPLAVGQTLAVVSRTGSDQPQPVTGAPHLVAPGDTLLLLAARYNLSPAALAAANNLSPYDHLFPGRRLRIPGAATYRELPGEWVDVQVRPLPIIAGSTVAIYTENLLDGLPTGHFAGQSLRFTPHGAGHVALVGLDAFTEPGQYALELGGSGSRPWRPFSQALPVGAGVYGTQYITVTEALSDLLDPQIRRDEDAFLDTIYTQFTEPQQWEGLFQTPVTNTVVTAGYGDGRSYNSGPVEIFHTGVDFAGTTGTPILAPANGTVVYTGTLQLRGDTLIIDHGVGVMTAYFHLSQILVNVGDRITAGQAVAAGGSTGLSTGPHLHWDLRVMGVAVNPLQWTAEPFP
jgi:murein DD-endopeptidase MepM/ murein hydrolase activator NlpD